MFSKRIEMNGRCNENINYIDTIVWKRQESEKRYCTEGHKAVKEEKNLLQIFTTKDESFLCFLCVGRTGRNWIGG